MKLRILGCNGGIGHKLRTTSFLVNDRVLLDAGTGVGDLTLDEMLSLRHVLLTHAHLDHIAGLALMFASIYEDMLEPVTIYAPEDVLAVLRKHLFNWQLWPDFNQLPDQDNATLKFQVVDEDTTITITPGFTITPIELSHTVKSVAYIIQHDDVKLCFCGDTGPTNKIWQTINNLEGVDHLIIEASYPNEQADLAQQSGHFTPKLLAIDLNKLNQKPSVHIQHMKPGYEKCLSLQCKQELQDFNLNILARCDVVELAKSGQFSIISTTNDYKNIEQNLSKLTDIAISLSAEQDNDLLLEKILNSAKEIANSDGGTIYTVKDEQFLQMDIVKNDSMGISLQGSNSDNSTFAPLPLYLENGEPNKENVVTCAIHEDIIIDIKDRHADSHYDFSGAQRFDESTGYNSISFLTIPMKDHKGDMIGALQLINALDSNGKVIPFSHQIVSLIKALASQAAITLTNKNLIDELELLFESFIKLLAGLIDEKSPYTGGHCRRVPELTIMLTEAIHATRNGPLKDFFMTEDDRYELKIAAWLHDCGKITTPEHVVDKATKLETIFDRIHLIDSRFETIRRDLEISFLKQQLIASQNNVSLSNDTIEQYKKSLSRVTIDQVFIQQHNSGGEFMTVENQDQVIEIAERYQISDYHGEKKSILSADEIENMQISRGTLNAAEREIINKHIIVTIDMLTGLKLPKHLKNVPEIAGGHHERMDGKGYPYGLTKDQMSVQTRAMGIADIFEALTASDRPYKEAKTISDSLTIMKRMKDTGHIDADIFDVFVRNEVYSKYADKFLMSEQNDQVNKDDFLD
jgi:HD-GYP domain-containing protein (c-di-GMP phosphodiesterase class II)/ribonuclease BN (tRNA processing enzyme)